MVLETLKDVPPPIFHQDPRSTRKAVVHAIGMRPPPFPPTTKKLAALPLRSPTDKVMQWEHKYSAPQSVQCITAPKPSERALSGRNLSSSHGILDPIQYSIFSHQSLITSIPDWVSTPATTPPYIEAWPLKYAFTRSLLSAYQCES